MTDFIADVEVGNIPFTVSFTDTSTGSPDHWWWDFGDGTVGSADQNPTHTYLCTGDFSVTLTAWVETVVNTDSSSILSTKNKNFATSVVHTEANAWVGFLATAFSTGSGGAMRFQHHRKVTGIHEYNLRHTVFRLDLTPYTKGDVIITLKYRYRFLVQALSCVVPDDSEFWISNDRLGDIPIFKFINPSGIPTFADIQMISSPDLAAQFDHAGEIFDLELKNGKRGETETDVLDNPTLFQQSIIFEGKFIVQCVKPIGDDISGIEWQRIGLGCLDWPPPGTEWAREAEVDTVSVDVHEFSSQDSTVKVNFITANSNIIARPPILYSGIKEAYFKDGWENEKHFYIEQSKAQPCNVQFVDIYAETENE